MSWHRTILPEAMDDIASLDGPQRVQVRKAINKVSQNPFPPSVKAGMASRSVTRAGGTSRVCSR